LPLGAGCHSVRLNGIAYEAMVARVQRREPCDLYHSALEVRAPSGRFVIEMTPVRAGEGTERDIVAFGAVGSRWVGRFPIFRYQVRRWRDGYIPGVAEAVDSPRQLSADPQAAQRLLDLVPQVPTRVWGRDELATGDMWNSNSLIAWLLTRVGIDGDSIRPPARGRAPGWQAGLGRGAAAARSYALLRNERPKGATMIAAQHPVRFSVEYPDRDLNRLTTAFRIFTVIPIAIVLGAIGGYSASWANGSGSTTTLAAGGTGLLFLPPLLMIVFRQKYPRWWFDWNLELLRFSNRVGVYLALMDDRYPSTDERQSVRLEFAYPDARMELNRWLPIVKWLLAIPH
jgi:hypothetical protein